MLASIRLDPLVFLTVRVVCELVDGSESTGTAFFLDIPNGRGGSYPCLVTNKHVVRGAVRGSLVCHTREAGAKRFEVEHFAERWIPHPEAEIDLCIMRVADLLADFQMSKLPIYRSYVSSDDIPSPNALRGLQQIEHVTMVGYPNGLWDSVNNMPLVRRGTTATHIGLDWEGTPNFMIDMACFPGSSGSPVFRHDLPSPGLHIGGAYTPLLVGVLHSGPVASRSDGTISIEQATNLRVTTSSMLNLGIVVKSHKLLDFVSAMKGERD